jgi:hypothetical protein
MAVDFTSNLTRRAVSAVRKPPLLPLDNYPGIIRRFEYAESRNKTPLLRYHIGLSGWGDNVPDQWDCWDSTRNESYTVQRSEVNLAAQQLRRDFYLTDDALYRLKEFWESCGVEPSDPDQDVVEWIQETAPTLVGHPVLVEVQQYTPQSGGDQGNQVGALRGL